MYPYTIALDCASVSSSAYPVVPPSLCLIIYWSLYSYVPPYFRSFVIYRTISTSFRCTIHLFQKRFHLFVSTTLRLSVSLFHFSFDLLPLSTSILLSLHLTLPWSLLSFVHPSTKLFRLPLLISLAIWPLVLAFLHFLSPRFSVFQY